MKRQNVWSILSLGTVYATAVWSVLSLGTVYSTPGATDALERAGQNVAAFLDRYLARDWGAVRNEDWDANDKAVEQGGRIIAAYLTAKAEKLWVITEADRSATTFLLPDEY